MDITVNDILALKGFEGAQIVAGKEGLSNIVGNATLMEVPDIFPYVDVNSLLITTLYPIYNNQAAINQLIPKLADINLAGICIKPLRYIKEIPPTMLRQADKLNFPIIELPPDANLSSLVTDILELSLNNYINILKFRNYVHEHLMTLFLKGEDIDSLVCNLAEIVKYPIILLDNSLNIICKSQDLAKQEVSIESPYYIDEPDVFSVKVGAIKYGQESYIKCSINAGQTKFGYIVLLKGDTNNKSLIIAVEQASLLIASAFYKNYAVLEKERTFQDAFIRNILQGKMSSQIEAINKARVFGWNMQFPQVILVIKVLLAGEKKEKKLTELYKYILDSRLIEKSLKDKMILINDNKFKIIYLDDALVLFINVSADHIKKSTIEVGKLIVAKLKDKVNVGIGISNLVSNIDRFPSAYQEAHNSLIVGSTLNIAPFVCHYDDYKVFNIIKEVKDQAVLTKYVEEKLGKIIEYDQTTSMELMETLRVLLEENFNAIKAAKRLFIHYNTLRYRIKKLKQLGIDIEDGFEIGEIVLAYNIHLWLIANTD
ncbi:MAG: PucR family transcriptional regulator ligand-binding domain-containing protein [Halanaerobiales bacterium]|nr:PucR family transcriptional regulator ligand-binding domain-containing protein [Halanaerobiales bacterium]